MKLSLPNIFKKQKDDVYAGLMLAEEGGSVLYIKADADAHNVAIIGSQKLHIRAGLDGLIDDLDDALYNLDTKHKVRATELILLVSNAHIDPTTRQLHKPFIKSVKDLSKNLELKPIGFIECYDAMLRTYRQAHAEDAHHAILLEVENASVSLMVVVGDAVVHQDRVARLDDWLASVNTSLATLKHKYVLPTTIIAYSPDNTPVQVKAIEGYDWAPGLFPEGALHVVHYSHTDLVDSLLESFSKQLYPQAQAIVPTHHKAHESERVPVPAYQAVEDEPAPHDSRQSHDEQMDWERDEEVVAAGEDVESLGFAVGHDVPTPAPSLDHGFSYPPPTLSDFEKPHAASSDVAVAKKRSFSNPLTPFFTLITSWMHGFKKGFGTLFGMGGGSHKVVFVTAALISLAALVVLAEFTLHHATVTVTLPSDELTQTVRLPSGFNYKQATVSSTFTAKTNATGETFVGDRAKGTVTLYNSDTSGSVSLNKGQTITSSDGLVFKLDDAVKIASASGDASSISSSTAKASITAANIGTEYNLKTGAKFSIEGFSSSQMIGKNESDISGGTKKKVTVVSEKDYARLNDDVTGQAQAFTQKKLKETTSSDAIIVPEFTETTLSKKTYTSDVGDEAPEVSLDATATVSYTAVTKADALAFMNDIFTKDSGASKKILPETFTFSIKKAVKATAGSKPDVTVEGHIKTVARVDQNEIKKGISYKSVSEADAYLRNSYRATDVSISQRPPLPLWIPSPAQITLTIEY